MSPKYVRPSVKTNTNDGGDAEAICEVALSENEHAQAQKNGWGGSA